MDLGHFARRVAPKRGNREFPVYARPLIVVNIFDFIFKKIGFKNRGFLIEFWTLDGLERSGRPVGIISTYFRQQRSGGFRVMTKKPIIFTTIKFTSIKV